MPTGADLKKLFIFGLMIAALALPEISAADNTTVSVTAEVVAMCRFVSGGSISYTLDPSVGGSVNGTITQPTFWCTNGTAYSISSDYGLYRSGTQRRLRNTATPATFIPYSLNYATGGTGSGKGTTLTMNITSSIVESAYINAREGSDYSDTVTLTLNP